MSAEIEILTGPACSGKTATLLSIYRSAVVAGQSQQRLGRTLWLAPTYLVAEQVRRHLSHGGRIPVLLAPQVLTFDGFADRILQYTTDVMRHVPQVMQRVMLRHLIDDLVATGKIQYFSGIAGTPGFLDVMLGLIAELKREEAWPEHFSAACERRGALRADMEAAFIYENYQAQLLRHNRYDFEGQFWSARDQLVNGHWGPFAEFDLIVVDGFSDFTHTQYEILGHLASRSQRVILALPGDDTGMRPELFGKPQQAFERLSKATPCRIVEQSALEAGMATEARSARQSTPPAIQHIARSLFGNPRENPPSRHSEGLEILAVTGMQGEVRAIAERVKTLLVRGVPAREIVVAFRPLADYAALIREVFSGAGIPFFCDHSQPLNQQPVIKALLALLQLEADDWPFERLNAVLNSGWFRPRWPQWSSERTPRRVANLLRRAKVPVGRTAILAALGRLSAAAHAEDNLADSPVVKAVEESEECLRRLNETLHPLRQVHDARDWAEALTKVARDLGIVPRTADGDGPLAMSAWKSFEDLLFIAAGTEELLGQGARRLDLAELLSELADLLQHQSLPVESRLPGAVEVLEATQVRGLDIPHLFLGGLTESSFPQHGGDTFLFTEADRRELNALGLTLGHRTAQTQAEMLMFYSIVTRAKTRLTLSYPAVSLDGQPLSPSPYLTTLRELFMADVIPVTHIEQLDPVPNVDSILTLSDFRIVATAEALKKRPGWFQSLAVLPVSRRAAVNIRAAVDMSLQRFQTRGFGPYEGIITQRENLHYLRAHYSSEQEFSATQLEGYAQCPFRFWVTDVLRIREAESPAQFTDHGLRGSIVHDILLQLHQELEPVASAVPIDDAARVFRRLLSERLKSTSTETELLSALLRIEQRLLEEWGDEYAQQWADYHAQVCEQSGAFLKPVLFETSFGTPHSSSRLPDETEHPCLTLGHAEAATRIRGRIDRIDVGEINGQPVFNIVDYKTGRRISGTANQVKSGRSLQLVLYALATQRLNLAGNGALPLQAGYWFLRDTGWAPIAKPPKPGADGLEVHADWQAMVDVLDDLIPRLAEGMRSGVFPVYNSDHTCTAYCPYKTACRVSQVRSLEEALGKQWSP